MNPVQKRFCIILAVCVLILLIVVGHAAYVHVWTSGYIEGYQAALNARAAEIVLEKKNMDHALIEITTKWVDVVETVRADCLKWKPKRPVVLPDPLMTQ